MDNNAFLGVVDGETIAMPQNMTEPTGIAYGLYVNKMPHREALVSLKHLLEETENPEAKEIYMKIRDAGDYSIGKIRMSLEKYAKIEQVFSLYRCKLVYVIEGVWQDQSIPKTQFITTVELKGQSIFDYI